jgi:hypothetical protein
MLEIGQLCNIELDGDTIYKIIDVRTKTTNIVTEQAQTFTTSTFVDVEEVENQNVKRVNIPIYSIHVITE